jgi:hypothetical protein
VNIVVDVSIAVPCNDHVWERYLKVVHGVECVLRCCRRCGCEELCWSRRPILFEADEGRIDKRSRSDCADKD